MKMDERGKAMMLGLGLDGGDGHKRLTKGENFVLAGGNVTVTVTTDFTEKTLKYLAVDSKGEELYSFNFPYAQVPLTDEASQEGEGE